MGLPISGALLDIAKCLGLCVLVALLYLSLWTVNAQTASITQVNFPSNVLAGSLEPIPISAIIPYRDARAGYWLLVGIVDPQLNLTVVPGIATASPNQCVNTAGGAYCRTQIQSESGVENLQFKIGGIFASTRRPPGSWNLQITALFLSSNGTVLVRLDTPFIVNLVPVSLKINIPSNVTVVVDGIANSSGEIPIALGRHSISIPMFVPRNETARLRFDHWSDGVTQPNRTITISSNTQLTATYLTQYRLVLSSSIVGADISGAGWYDSGSLASFSVTVAQPPSAGILGYLGAKVTFQGWFENGKSVTGSTSGTVEMTSAHTIQAQWKIDYLMPIIIFTSIGVALGIGIYLVKRPRQKPREKRLKARRKRTRS